MEQYIVFGIRKLKASTKQVKGRALGLQQAIKHILRLPIKDSAINIDASRTRYNRYFNLHASGNDYLAPYERVLNTATNKYKKDAVLAYETVISASPAYFLKAGETVNVPENWDMEKIKTWYEHQQLFIKNHLPGVLVNFALHLDETTPHIHAHVVPIDQDGKLNMKGLLGRPQDLRNLRTKVYEHNKKFGLSRGITRERRATASELRDHAGMVVNASKTTRKKLEEIQTLEEYRRELQAQMTAKEDALFQLRKYRWIDQQLAASGGSLDPLYAALEAAEAAHKKAVEERDKALAEVTRLTAAANAKPVVDIQKLQNTIDTLTKQKSELEAKVKSLDQEKFDLGQDKFDLELAKMQLQDQLHDLQQNPPLPPPPTLREVFDQRAAIAMRERAYTPENGRIYKEYLWEQITRGFQNDVNGAISAALEAIRQEQAAAKAAEEVAKKLAAEQEKKAEAPRQNLNPTSTQKSSLSRRI